MGKFKIRSAYKPSGDQPKAIQGLVFGLQKGMKKQTLLGVTGSGKTFTVANVIQQIQLPTLVIAHNKTLAAQLCNEFREFFPDNAVEYFVSYYDYYQPEAYLPHSDTYIEKEAQINEEIDRLRHACTQALLTRRDVIIVASVSAIYGLGSPTEYEKIVLHLRRGDPLNREQLLAQLIEMQFERTNADLKRGAFRLRGQTFEIMPVNEEMIYRFEIGRSGLTRMVTGSDAERDSIVRIEMIDPVTRKVRRDQEDVWLFPAKHYIAGPELRDRAFGSIRAELDAQLAWFQKKGKVLEYERLKRRVNYDLALIKNIGYCNGIENYSRHFDGRNEGEPPYTLLDYFLHSTNPSPSSSVNASEDRLRGGKGKGGLPAVVRPRRTKAGVVIESREQSQTNNPPYVPPTRGESQSLCHGFLTVIDESHATIPQIRGMYFGDKSRKDTLVEHGFRLPSARDNRPLTFDEFEARTKQTIYVSATPAEYELRESEQIVEQIVRPTGLVDPEVIIRPVTGQKNTESTENKKAQKAQKAQKTLDGGLSQVEDLMIRIEDRVSKHERALVTTLTKKMAEDVSEYMQSKKIKVKYLHSDIQTLERVEVLTALRKGEIDVIVGVNLLREGLDLPEVSLVAILDADKEGFLRSETSLVQTIGRAARNINGQVVLYADNITGSIERAMKETSRRREIQLVYNKEHGITPKTIEKTIRNILEEFGIDVRNAKTAKMRNTKSGIRKSELSGYLDINYDPRPIEKIIEEKERQMKEAAKALEFELAAILRDEIRELEKRK